MKEDVKAEFIVRGIKAELDSELFPPAYIQTEKYKSSYENMHLEGYNDYYTEALLDCDNTAKEFSSKGVESTIYGDYGTTPGSYFCIIRTTPAKLKEIKDELDEDISQRFQKTQMFLTMLSTQGTVSSLTERKLLEGLKAGDVSVLENCMDKYSLYLLAVSAKPGREVLSREGREQIVSDSFLALWNNRDKPEKENIKSYLAAIVRNKTFDALRAYHVVLPLDDDILILACDDPEAETIKKELTELTKKLWKVFRSRTGIYLKGIIFYMKKSEILPKAWE